MEKFEATPLWNHFKTVSTDEQRVLVRHLVEYAAPLLARIPDTFPTYTLHDEQHAINVIHLMGELLGQDLQRLQPLECAILILSAYYHDIGMLYLPDELRTLEGDPSFEQFLKINPEAFIMFHESGRTVSDRLAEWYCRWKHADRVFVYLNALDDESFFWGVMSLREPLGHVCRSHNLEANDLLQDEFFPIDYLGQNDLRICAILLRLADLLDFDRTRSPSSLFTHLRLASGSTDALRASRTEWSKHLASDGFTFPANRVTDYAITLLAAPSDPTVEHDIREFLDAIEREFKECISLRRSCSERWRGLPLPEVVSRAQIQSRGYRYGDYRFELARSQVLQLFMGDDLYQSTYTFIRELVQNSIDTSRHREYYEHARGRNGFRAKSIYITDWRDKEGRRWVRIDDFGMGMDEVLVKKYFLAVGNSYYKSAEFEADLLRYAQFGGEHFKPISRFGIGLLSCFLMADHIEVSTRRISDTTEVSAGLRLSLNGIDGYYTLQTEPLRPRPMPARDGAEKSYRAEVGTSVSVRIDAAKEEQFDLLSIVRRYVMSSPIDVTVNGTPIALAENDLVSQPWRQDPTILPVLPTGQIVDVGDAQSDPGAGVIKIVPLNLTANSSSPGFGGQMLLIFVRGLCNIKSNTFLDVRFRRGILEIPETALHPDPRRIEERAGILQRKIRIDISNWIRDDDRDAVFQLTDALCISHNGIRVPSSIAIKGEEDGQLVEANIGLSSAAFFDENDKWSIELDAAAGIDLLKEMTPSSETMRLYRDAWVSQSELETTKTFSWTIALRVGALKLADELQPIYSVSRDVIRGWTWNVLSCVHLAYIRAMIATQDELANALLAFRGDLFSEYGFGQIIDYSMRTIIDDPLFYAPDGWRAQPILLIFRQAPALPDYTDTLDFRSLPELVSFDQLVATLRDEPIGEFFVRIPSLRASKGFGFDLAYRSFLELMVAALMQDGVRLAFDRTIKQPQFRFGGSGMVTCRIVGLTETVAGEGLLSYPPCAFVEYVGVKALRCGEAGLNIHHPMSRWLLDATPDLRARKPGILASLWQELTMDRDSLGGDALADSVARVNRLLDSIRYEGSSAVPPAGLILTAEDYMLE